MASDTLILERLAAVTNLLNEIQANAKRTEEFPEQDPINASSKVRISLAGVSYWVTLQQITELVNSIGFNAISFGSGVVDETLGDNTTIEEITAFINEVGFTVSASLILQLSIVVKKTVNGLACFYVKKYNFRRNNIIGDWGTGSDNGEIFENDLLETGEIFLAVIPIDENDVLFDLGNIGSSTIYGYINATDSTSEPWRELLNDGSVYHFLCLINDSEQLYRYDGTLPKTIGLGETEVFFSDFDLIGTTGEGGGETEPVDLRLEQLIGKSSYFNIVSPDTLPDLNVSAFYQAFITSDESVVVNFTNLPIETTGYYRRLDVVLPVGKTLTITGVTETHGTIIDDGVTVNRVDLYFANYETEGLRIVAVINGGSSSGSVTSVAVSGSDGIEVDSGSPITTSGTIALGLNKTNTLAFLNVEDGADVTDAANIEDAITGSLADTLTDTSILPFVKAATLVKITWANFKAAINTALTSFSNWLEEKLLGTATYNGATTGASNLDISAFSSHYAILTGNTTHTLTGIPASGKTVAKTWIVKSTTTQSYAIANADKTIGSYVADGTENRVTADISVFPTKGQYIVITYENLV